LGFIPVEVNASDTRNKADKNAKLGIGGKLANSIKELATNRALGAGADGQEKKVPAWPSFCALTNLASRLNRSTFAWPLQASCLLCKLAGLMTLVAVHAAVLDNG
jgi:hypothetical protein